MRNEPCPVQSWVVQESEKMKVFFVYGKSKNRSELEWRRNLTRNWEYLYVPGEEQQV